MPVVVERNGTRLDLTLRLPPRPLDYWFTRPGATLFFVRLAQFASLLAGLSLALRRPRAPDALAASWFLMTCAVFLIALPSRLGTLWRELPIPIRELFWIPYASGITIGPVLLTFVTLFPRRLPEAGAILVIAWVSAGVSMAGPLYHAMQLVYVGEELRVVGPNSLPLIVVSTVALSVAVLWSLSSYRRIEDINERRRLRIVVAGIATAVIPGFFTVVCIWLFREPTRPIRCSTFGRWRWLRSPRPRHCPSRTPSCATGFSI
jgi:hypothetical protein